MSRHPSRGRRQNTAASSHPKLHVSYSPRSTAAAFPATGPSSLLRLEKLRSVRERDANRDEEQEAKQRGGWRGRDRAQRRRVQDGEEGRGEEPAAAHEGALPQAVLPHPALRRQARVPCLGAGVLLQYQQGHGDAAGPPGQRGGVHQAAQGADRGAEAAQGRWLPPHAGSGGGDRRRAHAGDRGAVPGRDARGGACERGRAAVQVARGDHGAGAGGRRGRQRQLLRRRGQDLLHHPLAGAQLQDRARGIQGLREAAGPAPPRLINHSLLSLQIGSRPRASSKAVNQEQECCYR